MLPPYREKERRKSRHSHAGVGKAKVEWNAGRLPAAQSAAAHARCQPGVRLAAAAPSPLALPAVPAAGAPQAGAAGGATAGGHAARAAAQALWWVAGVGAGRAQDRVGHEVEGIREGQGALGRGHAAAQDPVAKVVDEAGGRQRGRCTQGGRRRMWRVRGGRWAAAALPTYASSVQAAPAEAAAAAAGPAGRGSQLPRLS